LHTAAADHAHRVLLQIVPLARDVAGDFHPVGEAHTSDLAKRRVRLLRGRGVHANADAAPLGASLERGRSGLALLLFAPELHELIDGRHFLNSYQEPGSLLTSAPVSTVLLGSTLPGPG